MNELSHYATCLVWETGNRQDCDCHDVPPWRVRKESAESFPWRVWRWTEDGAYEHFVRCSSFTGAIKFIRAFADLQVTLEDESHA